MRSLYVTAQLVGKEPHFLKNKYRIVGNSLSKENSVNDKNCMLLLLCSSNSLRTTVEQEICSCLIKIMCVKMMCKLNYF